MFQIKDNPRHKIIIGLFFLALFLSAFLFFLPSNAFKFKIVDRVTGAAPADWSLSGWGWSSNIGWISFNCQDQDVCNQSNYKVYIASTTDNFGALKGYAWSSNIGWIQADPPPPYPADPKYPAKIDFNSGKVSGWLRALSYSQKNSQKNNDWDGWLRIEENNTTYSQGILNGYAWGDLNIGWLRFINLKANVPVPACDFSANPSTINLSQTATLSWDCENVDQCQIYAGTKLLQDNLDPQGTLTVKPNTNTEYLLKCENNLLSSEPISVTTQITVKQPSFKIKEVIPQ